MNTKGGKNVEGHTQR